MRSIRREMVTMPVKRTMNSTGIAIVVKAVPKRSTWATSASAITAPERTARKMFTRASDSV